MAKTLFHCRITEGVTGREKVCEEKRNRRAVGTILAIFLLVLFGACSDYSQLLSEDVNSQLFRAAFAGHVETIQSLLDAGADPDAQDEAGRTALSIAAKRRWSSPGFVDT